MKGVLKLLLASTLVASTWNAQAQKAPEYTTAGKIIKDYNYDKLYHGNSDLDFYLSHQANPNAPFVIILPKGNYTSSDREKMSNIAQYLMENNISSAIVDYKPIAKTFSTSNNASSYNDMLLNVWHAIQFIQMKADDLNIRKDNYIILGEDAGGHLALLSGYKFNNNIASIVSINSITDIRDLRPLSNYNGNASRSKTLFERFTGNTHYKSYWDVNEAYVNASPIAQIKNVPTLVIHSSDNNKVPMHQAVALNHALKLNNVKSDLIILDGAQQNINENEDQYSYMLNEIVRWIKG